MMAQSESLDTFVDLGNVCFSRRRIHAAGGSNSVLLLVVVVVVVVAVALVLSLDIL